MRSKWVDSDDYFGPDRRERRAMRLHDRRRDDETTEQPSLGATLRRLRVLLANPPQPNSHNRALNLIGAAVAMAESAQNHACSAALRRAGDALRIRPDDFDSAEPVIAEAMSYL
ncbi:MAG: hypothetical protein QM759_12530 [Terricaulis sp.]